MGGINIPLQIQAPKFTDPLENYSRAMSLADLADQRRYRALAAQAQIMEMQQRQRDMAEYESFRQALSRGARPEELPGISPKYGIDYLTKLNMQQKEALERQIKQGQIQKDKFDTIANDMIALKSLPLERRPAFYGRMVEDYTARGWRKPTDPVDPIPDDDEIDALLQKAMGAEKYQTYTTAGKTAARAEAKAPFEQREAVAKATTAEQAAAGTQPITPYQQATLNQPPDVVRSFESTYLPGWKQTHGITGEPTPAQKTQAFTDYQQILHPSVPPSLLPAAVEAQRLRMAEQEAKYKKELEEKNKPLSAEASKVKAIADSMVPEAMQLQEALRTGGRGAFAKILAKSDQTLSRLAENVSDKVGRIRSGGAVNAGEEKRFMGQIARFADLWSGDPAPAIAAIQRYIEEAKMVSAGIDPVEAQRRVLAGETFQAPPAAAPGKKYDPGSDPMGLFKKGGK